MKITNETLQPDGSGWSAIAEVRGVLFVASYVNNRLTVRLAPYKYPPRRPAWFMESVQRWAEKRLTEIDPAWFELHRAMYNNESTQ